MDNLKKNHLGYIETIAMSVAIMAPTAAMALNVSLMASVASYSISLVFIIATIVIGMASISFIKFNEHFSTAGSVYTFTSKSLGKKVGFISGWLLFLTYLMFTAASSAEVGCFAQGFFTIAGIHIGWLPISIVCSVAIWIVSYWDVRISTRIMFTLEGISILLILILSVVILIKVGSHGGLNLIPLKHNSNSFSSLAQAAVYGILSFAGFEGASTLGEETKNPKKLIPLAIASAVFVTGLFYLVVSYAQVVGFGTNASGIKALAGSASPLGDLSSKFISRGFALVIMLGATLSAFSAALGSASAGSRMLFSLSRDGHLSKVFAKVHPKYGSPYISLAVIMISAFVLTIPLFKCKASDAFGYLGTIGVLALLLAYLSTNVGAIVYFTKNKIWNGLQLIMPTIAVLALGFTFYSNIYPVPPHPYNIFPYIVLGWIIIGIFLTFRSNFDSAQLTDYSK